MIYPQRISNFLLIGLLKKLPGCYPPKELHKALQSKARLQARILFVQHLAEELKVEMAELESAIEILEHLQILEVEPDGAVQLTTNGIFANLD